MNGRTFYAVGSSGSRVVLAAAPRLTPLGLYGHRTACCPSRPAVRPRATLARRCGRRKRNAVRRTAASRTTRPPPGRAPRLTPLGLYGHRIACRPSRPAVRPRATLARRWGSQRATARAVRLSYVTNNFRRPAGVCGGSSFASPAAARAGGESTRSAAARSPPRARRASPCGHVPASLCSAFVWPWVISSRVCAASRQRRALAMPPAVSSRAPEVPPDRGRDLQTSCSR